MTTDTAAPIDTNEQGTAQDYLAENNDPMLAALKDEGAEDEAEGKDDGNEGQPATQDKAEADDTPPAKADGGDKNVVMIPKPRLDEVLQENQRLKDALTYQKGIVDTQKSMIEGAKAPAAATDDKAGKTADEPAADDYDAQIAKAEDGIIALAQKYEDGEITTVEYEKSKLDLSRQIRTLNDTRTTALVEGVKTTAKEVVTANNRQMTIETEAAKIQAEHPYIAEIDALPPAISKGVWDTITAEAYENLKAKGINPNDGKTESRLELIKEKAALTNKYGPQFTGKQIASQSDAGKPQMSPTAKERADKLDLAAQQPPATSQAGYGADKPALTETDIENMTDDQLADLETSNPGLLEKVTGQTQR